MKGFESEREVEKYFRRGLKKNNKEAKGWGAVVFDKGVSNENLTDSKPHHTISYKIRLEKTGRSDDDGKGEDSGELVPPKQRPGPIKGFIYYRSASSMKSNFQFQ